MIKLIKCYIKICHCQVKISYFFNFIKAPSWAPTSTQCMGFWYIKFTTPIKYQNKKYKVDSLTSATYHLTYLTKTFLFWLEHSSILTDFVMGRPNVPITTLTKLQWVLLGSKTKKDRVNASVNHIVTSNVEELVHKFWKEESYGTLSKKDPTLLPKNDTHALQILESTTINEKDRYSVGLLWKDDKPSLPYNRNMAISRMLSL